MAVINSLKLLFESMVRRKNHTNESIKLCFEGYQESGGIGSSIGGWTDEMQCNQSIRMTRWLRGLTLYSLPRC